MASMTLTLYCYFYEYVMFMKKGKFSCQVQFSLVKTPFRSRGFPPESKTESKHRERINSPLLALKIEEPIVPFKTTSHSWMIVTKEKEPQSYSCMS